jgi:ferredoxin-NADP reductase
MFVMISGIDKATQKEMVARAFSIASEPVSDVMEFFVVKEHGGHVSHFMEAQPGDPYIITGPHGQFKFTPEQNRKVLFIAGGTGLAPFMSMLRHIRRIKATNDVVLLYSVKYPTEIIRKDELYAMQQELSLKLAVTVTRPQPGDGWSGETGHISPDTIKKYAPDFLERTEYICGPLAFVKAMKDALSALNVPPTQVKADVWG